MSVFICARDTLAVFDKFLAGSFLKPFNKLAVHVLSCNCTV